MSYKKQLPIRITIKRSDYDLLINALKANETDFTGYISDEAEALREKIEKYGRCEIDEEGNEFFNLHFFEKEGKQFIFQFIATASILADFRNAPEIDYEDETELISTEGREGKF